MKKKFSLFISICMVYGCLGLMGCGQQEYGGIVKVKYNACKSALGDAYDPDHNICYCEDSELACKYSYICDTKNHSCSECLDGTYRCENGSYQMCAWGTWYAVGECSWNSDSKETAPDCTVECKGNLLQTCENGKKLSVECSGTCEDGRCVEKVDHCDKALYCENNQLVKCTNGYLERIPCPFGCNDGNSECNVSTKVTCNPNESKCEELGSGLATQFNCDADGKWGREIKCSINMDLSSGCDIQKSHCSCVDNSISKKCDINSGMLLTSTCINGNWQTATDLCAKGCYHINHSNGQADVGCVDNAIVSVECTHNNETRCNGSYVETCDDGRWVRDDNSCANGCEGNACKPNNDVECKDENGQPCPNGCNQETGKCNPQPSTCDYSSPKCESDNLVECKNGEQVVIEECNWGCLCSGDSCSCQEKIEESCNADDIRCTNPGEIEICGEDGWQNVNIAKEWNDEFLTYHCNPETKVCSKNGDGTNPFENVCICPNGYYKCVNNENGSITLTKCNGGTWKDSWENYNQEFESCGSCKDDTLSGFHIEDVCTGDYSCKDTHYAYFKNGKSDDKCVLCLGSNERTFDLPTTYSNCRDYLENLDNFIEVDPPDSQSTCYFYDSEDITISFMDDGGIRYCGKQECDDNDGCIPCEPGYYRCKEDETTKIPQICSDTSFWEEAKPNISMLVCKDNDVVSPNNFLDICSEEGNLFSSCSLIESNCNNFIENKDVELNCNSYVGNGCFAAVVLAADGFVGNKENSYQYHSEDNNKVSFQYCEAGCGADGFCGPACQSGDYRCNDKKLQLCTGINWNGTVPSGANVLIYENGTNPQFSLCNSDEINLFDGMCQKKGDFDSSIEVALNDCHVNNNVLLDNGCFDAVLGKDSSGQRAYEYTTMPGEPSTVKFNHCEKGCNDSHTRCKDNLETIECTCSLPNDYQAKITCESFVNSPTLNTSNCAQLSSPTAQSQGLLNALEQLGDYCYHISDNNGGLNGYFYIDNQKLYYCVSNCQDASCKLIFSN